MSNRPYPYAKNYSDLSFALHRIEDVIKEIKLELMQMQWVIEGTRHPDDLKGHRASLMPLIEDLKKAVHKEAKIPMEVQTWEERAE